MQKRAMVFMFSKSAGVDADVHLLRSARSVKMVFTICIKVCTESSQLKPSKSGVSLSPHFFVDAPATPPGMVWYDIHE